MDLMAKRTRSKDEVTLTVGIDPQVRKDFHIYVKKHETSFKDLIIPFIKETLELAGTYSPSSDPVYKPLLKRLLAEGKHTGKEIAEIVCSKIPGTKDTTVLQYLSDAKRVHHFTERVITDKPRKKCLCFGDPWRSESDVQEGRSEPPSGEETAD
jgi:hypothetical protein